MTYLLSLLVKFVDVRLEKWLYFQNVLSLLKASKSKLEFKLSDQQKHCVEGSSKEILHLASWKRQNVLVQFVVVELLNKDAFTLEKKGIVDLHLAFKCDFRAWTYRNAVRNRIDLFKRSGRLSF